MQPVQQCSRRLWAGCAARLLIWSSCAATSEAIVACAADSRDEGGEAQGTGCTEMLFRRQ